MLLEVFQIWRLVQFTLPTIVLCIVAALVTIGVISFYPTTGPLAIIFATHICMLAIVRSHLAQNSSSDANKTKKYLNFWALFLPDAIVIGVVNYYPIKCTIITSAAVFLVSIMWSLILIVLGVAAVRWTFRWASIVLMSICAISMSPCSVLGQPYTNFLIAFTMISGDFVGRSLFGYGNSKCRVIKRLLFLEFEENPADIFHKSEQFRRSHWITVFFCTAAIVLVMGVGDMFPNIWIETRYELFFWVTTLLLRFFVHRQVRVESFAFRNSLASVSCSFKDNIPSG